MQHQIGQDRSPTPANPIISPTTITCPQCGCVEHIKNTISNGIHKCYCKSCLYYFSHCSTDDVWLVADLGLNFPPHERRGESVLNFRPIEQEWLKNTSKKFIKYKASSGASLSLLNYNLCGHKEFSSFLRSHPEVHCFEDIDRALIIKYMEENQSKGL